MKLGVIGLPNVGKSTLFNAITQAGAQAANYPFCTIEPNVGVVPVPDLRLNALSEIVKLDATVDRRVLRQQRDRLGALGYKFAPLSQDWHLAKA